METKFTGYDPQKLNLVQGPKPTRMFDIDGRKYRVNVVNKVEKPMATEKSSAPKFVALALAGALILGADVATVNIINDSETEYEPITYIIPSEVSGFDEIKIIVRADGSSEFLLADGSTNSIYNGVYSDELLIKASSMGMLYRDNYDIGMNR